MNENIKIRIISGRQMNEGWQPDEVKWPENSLVICAYDEAGMLKGRVGLIMLPHLEGFWVAHSKLATGLSQQLEHEAMQLLKERFGSTFVLTFLKEKANGLAKTIEKGGWNQEPIKVFSKEIGKCQR